MKKTIGLPRRRLVFCFSSDRINVACDPSRASQSEQIAVRRSSAVRKKTEKSSKHSPAADVAHDLSNGISDQWLFSPFILEKRGAASSRTKSESGRAAAGRGTENEKEKKTRERERRASESRPNLLLLRLERNEDKTLFWKKKNDKKKKLQPAPGQRPAGEPPPVISLSLVKNRTELFFFLACAFLVIQKMEETKSKRAKNRRKKTPPPLSSSSSFLHSAFPPPPPSSPPPPPPPPPTSASRLKLRLPSAVSLCTNSLWITRAASFSRFSFDVAPWSTGAILRPSSSKSFPPDSTKATKWRSTASSSPGGRVSPLTAAVERGGGGGCFF